MPFPVEEEYILQTEKKLGVTFPPSFRERMIKNNGGEVKTPLGEWNIYPFSDSSDRKRIKRTFNDIVRETSIAREWGNFPKEAIAIGSDGCGNQLIFIRSADESLKLDNRVFWWDHETGEIHKIAGDFKELI